MCNIALQRDNTSHNIGLDSRSIFEQHGCDHPRGGAVTLHKAP